MSTKQTPKARRIAAQIEHLNALYKEATPAQRRVLIAKDALEQIKVEKYQVCSGKWAVLSGPPIKKKFNLSDYYSDEEVDYRPLLMESSVTCNVCGIGSLFLSAIRFRNDHSDDCREVGCTAFCDLSEFSVEQRELIEATFENNKGYIRLETLPGGAHRMINKNPDSKDRLIAILKNIIKNRGTFKP